MEARRLFHTLRFLKPVQIYGRVWFRLVRPRIDLQNKCPRRILSGAWVSPAAKSASQLTPNRFRFLNIEHELSGSCNWNDPEWDKLWQYNLHYFDDLNAVGAASRVEWHTSLIDRWIRENSPCIATGWEPYPISLRIVNWIKWSLAGNTLSMPAELSLAVQARYLRKKLEIHLLGNHLLANAKALVFAGLFFSGEEANGWLDKGLSILDKELPEQVLADGGHFERSPMYHAIILDDLLDLINLMHAYWHEIPPRWCGTAERMLTWLAVMQHPDGNIALFNDSAFGIAPKPAELFDYARRLGLSFDATVEDKLANLSATGYLRIKQGGATVFLDVAPIGPDYLPGHAHADTLSFEFSLLDQRIIVDSGTSCYGRSKERLRQRGTAAHNTVTINGLDSSEVWGGFRVARRAMPFDLSIKSNPDEVSVACSHNGYQRLPGKPVHRRELTCTASTLRIKDIIQGPFDQAVARYHFHPAISVTLNSVCSGKLILKDGLQVTFTASDAKCKIVDSTWNPEFGLSLPSRCLEVALTKSSTEVQFQWV